MSIWTARTRTAGSAALVLALLITISLAACNSEVTSGASKDNEASASNKAMLSELAAYRTTLRAGSADISTIFDLKDRTGKVSEEVTQTGSYSWATDRGDFAFSGGGADGLRGEELLDGKETYTKYALSSSTDLSLPSSTNGWVEDSWSGRSSPSSSALESLLWLGVLGFSTPNDVNPLSIISLLRAEASSIRHVGDQIIDGVETARYVALIPLSRLATQHGASLHELEETVRSNSIGIDLWIDSSHLLRQIRLSVDLYELPVPSTTLAHEVTIPYPYPITESVELQLTHYGVPVSVTPPAPAQVSQRSYCVLQGDENFSCDGSS